MFKDGDKITLESSDKRYLTCDGNKLKLTKDKKDAVTIKINVNERVIGFKFQIEIEADIFYINGDAIQGLLNLSIDSSATGTNWICAPVPVGTQPSGTGEYFLLIGLAQNGSKRFMNAIDNDSTPNTIAFPSLTSKELNSATWLYKLKKQ